MQEKQQLHSLLGLAVAHLQRGVVVDERSFQVIDSDSVDATLLAVQLDPVEVDHGGENGQLHKALDNAEQKDVGGGARYKNDAETRRTGSHIHCSPEQQLN